MRKLIVQKGKTDRPAQGGNKLAQEAGTFSITNKEKISSYSVIQSFIVEWQMQVLDFNK
jgi:hypothetical protein